MKRLALLSTVVAVAALIAFASTAAQGDKLLTRDEEPQTGVMYDIWDCEPDGILHLANAKGQFVEVFSAAGELVWCGPVEEDYVKLHCPNDGAGPEGEVLRVWTGGGALFCIDRDEDWIWE